MNELELRTLAVLTALGIYPQTPEAPALINRALEISGLSYRVIRGTPVDEATAAIVAEARKAGMRI